MQYSKSFDSSYEVSFWEAYRNDVATILLLYGLAQRAAESLHRRPARAEKVVRGFSKALRLVENVNVELKKKRLS